jgi:hypothetical protein
MRILLQGIIVELALKLMTNLTALQLLFDDGGRRDDIPALQKEIRNC